MNNALPRWPWFAIAVIGLLLLAVLVIIALVTFQVNVAPQLMTADAARRIEDENATVNAMMLTNEAEYYNLIDATNTARANSPAATATEAVSRMDARATAARESFNATVTQGYFEGVRLTATADAQAARLTATANATSRP